MEMESLYFLSSRTVGDNLEILRHFYLDLELKRGQFRTGPRFLGAQEEALVAHGRAEGETGLVAISNTGLLFVEL